MSGERAAAVLIIIALAGSFFVSKSEDNNSMVRLIEAVGSKPAASVVVGDSSAPLRNDSVCVADLVEFLSGLGESEDASQEVSKYKQSNDSAIFVLDYLADICDGTGFYESGSWEPKTRSVKYELHVGPLPEFDKSKLRRPVKGRVNSPFGIRPESGKMHLGVDFKGKRGDTVRVALPGRVVRKGFDRNGYGWYVCVVNNCGLETRYAHLGKVLVAKGDTVGCNMPVGLVGTTANSTGPHLHFEVRYGGKVVDPMLFLP